MSNRKGFRIIGSRLRITAAGSTHVLHYDMSPTFLVQVSARRSCSCLHAAMHPLLVSLPCLVAVVVVLLHKSAQLRHRE